MNWKTLPPRERVEKTMASLRLNGITTEFVESKEEAKEKVMSLLPKGAEVMAMTSVTLTESGIEDEVKTGEFDNVKAKLMAMDREKDGAKMQKLGAAPEYALGSVHAVTEEGHVLIASNTGSQLASYVYGSQYVIWVVGVQKIVANTDDGLKRIYEHSLPLESERAHKAYGMVKSNVSKILIINKEVKPGRITLIFVNESIGF